MIDKLIEPRPRNNFEAVHAFFDRETEHTSAAHRTGDKPREDTRQYLELLENICLNYIFDEFEPAILDRVVYAGSQFAGMGTCQTVRIVEKEKSGNRAVASFTFSEEGDLLEVSLWGDSDRKGMVFLSIKLTPVVGLNIDTSRRNTLRIITNCSSLRTAVNKFKIRQQRIQASEATL